MIAITILGVGIMLYTGLWLACERIAKAIEGLADNVDQLDGPLRKR